MPWNYGESALAMISRSRSLDSLRCSHHGWKKKHASRRCIRGVFCVAQTFFLHWRVLPAIEHVPFLTFMTYFIIAVFTEYVYFILFTELYIFAKIGRSGIKEFWSTTIYLYRYWYTRKHIIYRYTTIIYLDLEPGDARWTAQWADPADGAWRIHGVHGDLRILG